MLIFNTFNGNIPL